MQDNLYNLAFERSILSSIIFEPQQFDELSVALNKDDFYLPAHQDIFGAMLTLLQKDQPIDEEFIKKELTKIKKFDESVMLEILSANPISNTKAYVDEIKDKSLKRHLLTLTTEIKRVTVEEELPGNEVIDIVEKKLYEITQDNQTSDFKDSPQMTFDTLEYIKEMKARGNNILVGVDTGFHELNKMTTGFGKGDLVIIAARPAMGKTTFAVTLAADAARKGIKTLFISIEMNKTEIAQKFISHASGVHFNKIIEGYTFEEQDWTSMAEMLGQENDAWSKNLSIDDTSETTVDVMRSINWGINEGYKFIIVDHLHELAFDDRRSHISLTEAMGDFVKRLRNIAQRNNVALLALSQLNREVEKRSAKIPISSDLGESGTLERVAHNIIFLYRQEQHKGEVDVVVAKARGGQTGITTLDFDGGTNQVNDQKGNYGFK
jgi:replicative DNA helicase